MATAIRDLFVSVTTKVDASGLATLDKKLDGAKDKFGKFAAFIAGGFIAKGVASFVQGQLDFADALSKSSQKLGIATDELERFGFMAELNGPSAELLYAGLNKMNKAIGDNAKGFSELGVSLKNTDGSARGTSEVFQDVLGKFGGLETQGEKTRLAMELFGKSGTELLPMLTQGADETEKLAKRFEELGGATPQEFLDYSVKIKDAMTEFSLATLGAKQGVVMLLMPALLKIIKTLSEVVAKTVNFEKRTKLLSTGIKLLASMFAMLKLASLAGNLVKVGRAAMTLKTIFGGFKSVLMSGGLMLAALLIQDLITFATGGKSAIGDFLNALIGPEEAGAFAKQLLDAWIQVKDTLSALPGVLSTLTGALPSLIQGFLTFADVVSRIISLLWNVGKAILEIPATVTTAWHLIKGEGLTAEDDAAQRRRDKIENSLANVYDTNNFGGIGGTKAVSFAVPEVPSVPGGGAVSPSLSAQGWNAAPAAAPAPDQSVSQVNNNTITINASDPKGVGEVMRTALPDNAKKQLRDAKGALASKGAK